MSSEPSLPARAAPDRLLARATALALAAGVVVVLGAHLAMERAQSWQGRTAELAMIAADEAAAARAAMLALDRLGMAENDAAAAKRLDWDMERLLDLDARRLALTPGVAAGTGPFAAVPGAVAAGMDAAAARALLDRFDTRLLPQIDLAAARADAAADAARLRSRLVLAGSLAFQLAASALVLLGVIRPARRQVEAWLAETAEAERTHRFQLLHDGLTGLPNAAYLKAHLAQLVAGAERGDGHTAVLRVDLDRFKLLRETQGQRACDEVIRLAARRIRKSLRAGDFAAYTGNDDFVVVAADLDAADDAATVAGRVQHALAKPFVIHDGPRRVSASIGVTLLSDDRPEVERVLGNAEIALVAAQAAGPGSVGYFREDLRHAVEQREALFGELVRAVERREVVAFFQPQVDLATGALAGFEALVRWQHPEQGLLEPDAFLDFAEATDLSERIGELVLARSLEALQAWDAAGLAVPRVGVNFALAQLRHPRLVEKIKWEAERMDVAPDRVAIEVLETVFIKSDTDMVVRNLRGLASAGFRVELDDFGTGHASISNLRRFAVDRIKIDRSFITGIEESEEQQALTASMIAMAHALGIGTLAEGVETEAARATLARLGCDAFQGYLLGRPMSLADSLGWLAAYPGAAAAGRPAPDPIAP